MIKSYRNATKFLINILKSKRFKMAHIDVNPFQFKFFLFQTIIIGKSLINTVF